MRHPSIESAQTAGAAVSTSIEQWGKVSANNSAEFPRRYSEWLNALRRHELLPIERLLPTITIPDCGTIPPAMQRVSETPLDPQLLAAIRGYKWGYYFHLGDGQSTLGEEKNETAAQRTSRQRTLYRMNAINGAIAALYGGELKGKRVTDLACNHGAFSLDLIARGAAAARGVDIRPENIEKAKLLARRTRIEEAEFAQADIYDETGQSEIVLCLGLMYHVTKQYELIELCHGLCTEISVIDTITHKEPFSGFVLGLGGLIPQVHAAGTINVELHPTYRGLIDLMRAVGFREIVEVEGVPDPSWTNWDSDVYAVKTRRCLIGLK
ncbi:MAG TPA: methyltransferase domain-containing protein [Rhizomicrobium sp.]|jgi:SAM-dependent methyltransferase|nr:methyltransferase domain-containing protein [Rhizomicrobium sp.]